MAVIFKKQNKIEQAIQYALQAVELDLQLTPTQSFDRYTTTTLNVIYLLQADYKADKAIKYKNIALKNAPYCYDTEFAHLFNPKLLKQRVGIATIITTHLNGVVEILTKNSSTPINQWY